jgi:hypothetical protein
MVFDTHSELERNNRWLNEMENAFKLDVPLTVGGGWDWLSTLGSIQWLVVVVGT